MKPEEQRIAIAEACGWTQCQWNGAYDTLKGVPPIRPSLFQDIPDYLNDLNAMHEAEVALAKNEDEGWHVYQQKLRSRCGASPIFRATAAQRAEAFIRTIGKWNSDKINKTLE
jgi:hypothetical protein